MLVAGLRALGADADPLPIGDVYKALQLGHGGRDGGQPRPDPDHKFYEVAKFVTANVNLWPFPTVLVINKDNFDGLRDEEQQASSREAADKVPGFSIDIFTGPPAPGADAVQRGHQVRRRHPGGPGRPGRGRPSR